LVALIATSALVFPIGAQDGAYDTSFGNGGRTWIDVTSSTSDIANKLVRLPSGNFFLAGGCTSVACAAWLTPTGALATGYGTSGTGTAWFSTFSGWPTDEHGASDAAVFADGRIAVAVPNDSGDAGYLAVLKANGSGLDPLVGNGAGYVAPSFSTQLVRVTPQQQVIVVGYLQASPAVTVVARYDSTMHLDTSFGSGGSTTIGFSGFNTSPTGMTLQRDGKIVILATVGSSPGSLGIMRLTAGGAPDPDFGVNSDGLFRSAFGNMYGVTGNDIVEDRKGRLVFVGFVRDVSLTGSQWFVDRVLGGGATDAGFNGGQPHQFTIVDSTTAWGPHACCVAMQNDNRIVVAGAMTRPTGPNYYFAIARFLDDGSFDFGYGGNGQSYGDMSPQPDSLSDAPISMVIVPGGVVVGGGTQVTGGEVRYSVTKVRIDPLFASGFE